MRKILTIVGTRPELIKLSLVISKFDALCQHVLVHTGQNYDYELNQAIFQDLEIRKPDYFLDAVGKGPADTIGKIISKSDSVLEQEAPDAVLIYGDTNSGLSVISAKRRKIPVFHMEAGNRCFDQRVPEEINRKIIDHLSDVNIVLTEHARRYLLAEGFPGDRIFKVGSHLAEVLNHFRPKITASSILERLHLTERHYFLVSVHREENVDVADRLRTLVDALNGIADKFQYPVIVSTHPRTRQQLGRLSNNEIAPNVHFMQPFGFTDYVRLQLGACCVISDSGTITEEASLLDIPAITIRDAHERPEGMDAGALIMSNLDRHKLLDSIRIVSTGYAGQRRFAGAVPDYDSGEVSTKVVRIVMSYIPFVNRVVWYKNGDDQGST